MVEIGIADINKTPSIIDKLDDVAKITNKKTKDIKGFFIPYKYKNIKKGEIYLANLGKIQNIKI